jgi:glucose/arabinose dehydrogenase
MVLRETCRKKARALPALALAMLAALLAAGRAQALPDGFQQDTVISGLTEPTQVRFAPDGKIFVAEKQGTIEQYDSLSDSTPTTVVDLHKDVYNYWDRGLLGMAVDPQFPARPYLYLSYTYDRKADGSGSWDADPNGSYSDGCPTPPGPTTNGCDVQGRLVRVNVADGNTGDQAVLIQDWCQQYPSHSVGEVAFGPDGMLYMSGGDGASFTQLDLQRPGDSTPNPCGDPQNEGGMLRSQDWQTQGDPLGLDGSLVRVDPATGGGVPGNPGYPGSSPSSNRSRIIAYGMRNPFRFAFRPGTGELWVGDVGWDRWERIERMSSTTPSTPLNFGWPCYEGTESRGLTNIPICAGLYNDSSTWTPPYFQYRHNTAVVAGQSCGLNSGASVTGVAFAPAGGGFPARYAGALFFADYSQRCIYAMPLGAGFEPEPAQREVFLSGDHNTDPVDLEFGPNGDLFYVDLAAGTASGGTVHRVRYFPNNQPPTANLTASTRDPALGTNVQFTALGSSDPEGGTLTYKWDLDGNGSFETDTGTTGLATKSYSAQTNVDVRVQVTDPAGVSTTSAPLTIRPGNRPPTATISVPDTSLRWSVDQSVDFAGSATDPDESLGRAAMRWSLVLQHCPSSCHAHPLQTFDGVPSGSFVAPDHELPSYLTLTLTVTDARGATDTKIVRLDPRTVNLRVSSSPTGRPVSLADLSGPAPLEKTVIAGGRVAVSAAATDSSYRFQGWSDGVADASRTITAPAGDTELVARYASTDTAVSSFGVTTSTPTQPGSSPTSPPVVTPADRTPPKLSVGARSRQAALRTRKVTLAVRCPSEACTTAASGVLSIKGRKASYRLRSGKLRLSANQRAVLTIKLSSKTLKAVRAAAASGGRVRLALTVTATDAAGNAARTTRRITLTR